MSAVSPSIPSLQALPVRSIPRPRSKPLYLLSLWLVTALCLLMPLLYLGLIAGLGWLEYRYYTEWVPEMRPSRFIWGRIVAWTLPGFVGGILILFLLKPLFAPRDDGPDEVELGEGEEPELVRNIHALCAAMGIRPPAAIRLSHQVNAWVQFDRGPRGFFGGARVLTIGLPLVAGLQAQQFVGVLAHEFGHFAQGAGMRCSQVINGVNRWLWSRGYQHDEWDVRLDRWGRDEDNGIFAVAAWIARGCLWLTRGLMRLLFQISFRISRKLSQEMEFDADRYEATVAGSDCFRGTALQMRALMRAYGMANRQGARAWREGKLAADLSEAVLDQLQKLRKQDWADLELELQADDQTRYWDTHPADIERIANAERLQCAGLFLDPRPAREMFRDFAGLSRRVTEQFYRGMGLEFGQRNLVSTRSVLEMGRLPDELAGSWRRYGAGMLGESALLSPQDASVAPFAALDWQGCVDELRRLLPEASGLWTRLERRQARRREIAAWIALLDLGVDFSMPDGKAPDGVALRGEFADDEDSADARLAQKICGMFARRLQLAIASMEGPAREHAEAQWRLLQVLHDYSRRFAPLVLIGHACLPLRRGLHGGEPQLREWLEQRAARYRGGMADLLAEADQVALDDAQSLGKHLRNQCGHLSSAGDDPMEFIRVTLPMDDVLRRLARRTLAELAAGADRQESLHGIRPIRLLDFKPTPS